MKILEFEFRIKRSDTGKTDEKMETAENQVGKEPLSLTPLTPTSSKTIQLAKPKPKTVHRELLLSFNFFDTNRTHYILEKDLEDLLLGIGLSLTRSKLKALLAKLTFKDGMLNYRLLTDKTTKELAAESEGPVVFKLPDDQEIAAAILTYDSYMRAVAPGDYRASSEGAFNRQTGVIELNGSTIDVLNTLKDLNESEKTVGKLESKLKESFEEIGRLFWL